MWFDGSMNLQLRENQVIIHGKVLAEQRHHKNMNISINYLE